MRDAVESFEAARRAADELRWSEAYELMRHVDGQRLAAEHLELFADAAWWCCRVEEEVELRQRAFRGFDAAGNRRRAAYAAWLLSVRFGLRGDPVAASGWLQRALRQLAGEPAGVEHGYVACSQVEMALGSGDLDRAEAAARRGIALGVQFRVPELVALAVTWQGLCRLARKQVEEGLVLLDEAMASVAAGELDAHFTGWVSCFAVGLCMGVADVGRAASWARAAWEWAASLPESTPYQGLCRVRQVEVMSLRGDLELAVDEAERACEEMLAFEPHLAGEAFYVHGEILRRRGEPEAAEAAFVRTRELGFDPQPGLARLRLRQGHTSSAAAALRAALADEARPPFQRSELLVARVEVAVVEDDLPAARDACAHLELLASEVPSVALAAFAGSARGRLLLAEGDPAGALSVLRPAAGSWRSLEMVFELAETRCLIGSALRELGDHEGAEQEFSTARRSFEAFGAIDDADRVTTVSGDGGTLPRGLTARECEVLALVADGRTNRQIATALVISEHTVARHLSNIFTKLAVSTRTAAAAFAFEHDLVRGGHADTADGPS